MAATFQFCEDNGTAVGDPARGTTSTSGVSNLNWKNIDDATTSYASSPLTAGNRSFEKYTWGLFGGTFNSLSTLKWQHVSGVLGAGLQVVVGISGSGFYRSPATTVYANLAHDLTATGSISTGLAVKIGGGGPHFSGKNASTSSNPAYTEFISSQMVTTAAAQAGDTTSTTWTLQYLEN